MSDQKYYLTKEGLKKIKREYKKLLKLRQLKSKREVPPVLHSEELNTEFISYRDDLDFLDSRIAELENILKNYEFIKPPPRKERDKIHLGAQVQVEVDGQIDEFTIVGTLEANPSLGKISNESPVGKALMNRKVGEEVVISSPVRVIYKIKKIMY
ncbi:GreA/GreB family elongation factor [bacterium]|nr:GreA/GreB family elongation factor [bacterium]